MIEPTQRYREASARVLNFLRQTDTCTVSNAIETFNCRLRNEGFIQGATQCHFPKLPPIAGYAVTGRIRTSEPPIANRCYYHRPDWWEYVGSLPSPKVIVIHDVDRIPGYGAFIGEIQAQIAKALGCVSYVTNGVISDVPALEAVQFQCFACGTSVSHSYAHIIDFGGPVEIGGLRISPGDLLHGDCHGVQTIPLSIAEALPDAAKCILDREAKLLSFCESSDFSLEKLTELLNRESPLCQPLDRH